MSRLLQEALARSKIDASHDEAAAGMTSESDTEISLPATPADSRPPSRSGLTSDGASSKKKRAVDATSLDPLRRLPNGLSSRILVQLDEQDLKTLRRLSKRWKRSQTLNYVWFYKFQERGFDTAPEVPLDTHWKPTWTRRESKEDWFARYKRTYRRDDLEHASAEDADYERARSDGYRTPKEENEARWAAEEEPETYSKSEARAYYKSLKNTKAKGKEKFSGARSRDKSGLDMGGFD